MLKLYAQRGFNIRKGDALPFGHGALHRIGGGYPWLLASYHPSQQNTQTGRLTPAMFDQIWNKTKELLYRAELQRYSL